MIDCLLHQKIGKKRVRVENSVTMIIYFTHVTAERWAGACFASRPGAAWGKNTKTVIPKPSRNPARKIVEKLQRQASSTLIFCTLRFAAAIASDYIETESNMIVADARTHSHFVEQWHNFCSDD